MPRLTLQFGGALIEHVTGAHFFPPLFDELAQEPTINRDLLKGFARPIDDFAIGHHLSLLPYSKLCFVHLEMAVIENRRSAEVLDRLADRIANYTKRYFHLSLANRKNHCYITSDIHLVKARWHRSTARGRALAAPNVLSEGPLKAKPRVCPIQNLNQPPSQRPWLTYPKSAFHWKGMVLV